MKNSLVSSIIFFILIGVVSIALLVHFDVIDSPINLLSGTGNKEISFTTKSLEMRKGEVTNLEVENDTGESLIFTSSDPNIVSVNEVTGYISAVNYGTATITVQLKDHKNKKDECVITVIKADSSIGVESISLSNDEINLQVGGSKTIHYTITPSNAKVKKITWSTSNANVATIDKYGTITAIRVGTATITIKINNDNSATCVVNVTKKDSGESSTPPPTTTYTLTYNANGGSVSPGSKTLNKGAQYGNLPTPTKSGYTFNGWYTQASGGSKVSSSTTINGNTTIYAQWTKNQSGVEVSSVELNKTSISIKKGTSKTLIATIKPDNASNKTITWSSDNESVATVSNGTVTGKTKGKANITAKSNNGKTATCKVTVKEETNSSDYVITEHIPSGYTVTNKTYTSSTLKYKIITGNNTKYHYYALIWVKDANKQLNNGNSNYTRKTKIDHFNNEIKSQGYQKKGMIGTNGGFAIGDYDNIPILASKGKLKRNPNYKTWIMQNNKPITARYGTLSVSSSGKLIHRGVSDKFLDNKGVYSGSNTEKLSEAGYEDMKTWLKNNGARNTWGITFFVTKNWKDGTGANDIVTHLCQRDEHNFILAVGNNNITSGFKELHDVFGCNITLNLDGGGSTGMYYKTNSMSNIGTVYQYKRPNESTFRNNVDILYFVEQ